MIQQHFSRDVEELHRSNETRKYLRNLCFFRKNELTLRCWNLQKVDTFLLEIQASACLFKPQQCRGGQDWTYLKKIRPKKQTDLLDVYNGKRVDKDFGRESAELDRAEASSCCPYLRGDEQLLRK